MLFIKRIFIIYGIRSDYLLRPSVRYLPGGIPILLQNTLEK